MMCFIFRLLCVAAISSVTALSATPDLKAELRQIEADFCALAKSSGIEAAFARYAADDAVFFDVDPAQHRGPEAVRLRFDGLNPQAILSWTPVEVTVADSGELGYTWGTYEYRAPGPDGKERIGRGHYVSIWKRQPDGQWKFVLDTGSPNPPSKTSPL